MKTLKADTESFYDRFAAQLIADFVNGNLRIKKQLEFFRAFIPRQSSKILVIGCGSGESVKFIATKVAPRAKVLGLDLSSENVRVARILFPHLRATYRKMDFLSESPEGGWDTIALPDVYEHFPKELRQQVHARLGELLAPQGRILLTVPSPAHQAYLQARGEGLQPVDEDVALEDVQGLARDLGGVVSYFRAISVWRTYDYFHAVVERGAPVMTSLSPSRNGSLGFPKRIWRRLHSKWVLRKLSRAMGAD